MMRAKVKTLQVKEILLRRGISQNGLAMRLKITSGYCSQLLNGTRCPSPTLRHQLLKVLGEDFDTLFEIVDRPQAGEVGAR